MSILGASALSVCSCAHPDARERDAAFRRIQVHEAQLARCEARLWAETSADAARDVADLCAASEALCDESAALHDRDAALRCQRGRDACSAARARLPAHATSDRVGATEGP